MADLFNFDVQAAPSGDVSYRVLAASFGDGYVQTAAAGLNNKTQVWNVSAKGFETALCNAGPNIQAVKTFIDAHGGWKSFRWVPPGQVAEILVLCQGYTETRENNVVTLSFKFTQNYQP